MTVTVRCPTCMGSGVNLGSVSTATMCVSDTAGCSTCNGYGYGTFVANEIKYGIDADGRTVVTAPRQWWIPNR